MDKKKWTDIETPDGMEFYKFLGKSAVNGEWHLKQTAFSVLAYAGAVTVANDYGKGKLQDTIVAHATVQIACDVSQDVGTIYLGFKKLQHYPFAQKMLWHYLTGNGVEVEVDTAFVFSKDSKLKTFVFEKIGKDIKMGKSVGSVNVTQRDYGNAEWQNAFGSINVHWKKVYNTVELWIVDFYKWHPNEFRVTECVHHAMERAKTYGAKDFHYQGTKLYINLSVLNTNKGGFK